MKKHRKLLMLAETVCSPPEACGDKISRFIQTV